MLRFCIFSSDVLEFCLQGIWYCRTLHKGGAYEVWYYRNTVDYIANYRFTVDVFHEITNFHRCHVLESPNTVQNLLKLPFHRPKNCQIPITVILYAPPSQPPLPGSRSFFNSCSSITSLLFNKSLLKEASQRELSSETLALFTRINSSTRSPIKPPDRDSLA